MACLKEQAKIVEYGTLFALFCLQGEEKKKFFFFVFLFQYKTDHMK